MNTRTDRERAFHDIRYADGVGTRPQDSFYLAIADAKDLLMSEIEACVKTGGKGLEIGCANGENLEKLLATHPFTAAGIDISSAAVEAAKSRFRSYPTPPVLEVMDANVLTYPNDSFDFCFGSGVLHHLQLPQALMEARRVLRPGGLMIFMEPLATNPLIEIYRSLTPADRSPDETPLTPEHIKQLKSIFDQVTLEFFGFFTLGGLAFKRWPKFQRGFIRAASKVDNVFFKLPGAWRLAWMVVIKAARQQPRTA